MMHPTPLAAQDSTLLHQTTNSIQSMKKGPLRALRERLGISAAPTDEAQPRERKPDKR
jgi:hypothetical protein